MNVQSVVESPVRGEEVSSYVCVCLSGVGGGGNHSSLTGIACNYMKPPCPLATARAHRTDHCGGKCDALS